MSHELLDSDKLIAWLRQQPPEEEYIWSDPVFCLMGRYITDVGTPADLYAYSEMPAYREIAETKPWTFGAALQRAEALKQLPSPPLSITHERVAALPGRSADGDPADGWAGRETPRLPSPDRVG
jgi:hypothetical protein